MLTDLVPWFQLRRRILTDQLTVTFPIRIRSCCGHGSRFAGPGALVPAPVRILTGQLTVIVLVMIRSCCGQFAGPGALDPAPVKDPL